MLNLVQHLTNTRTYETLKQVQGDKSRLFTRPSYLTFFYFNPSFHSSIIPTFQHSKWGKRIRLQAFLNQLLIFTLQVTTLWYWWGYRFSRYFRKRLIVLLREERMARPIMMKRIPWRMGIKRPRIPSPMKIHPMIRSPIFLNSFMAA